MAYEITNGCDAAKSPITPKEIEQTKITIQIGDVLEAVDYRIPAESNQQSKSGIKVKSRVAAKYPYFVILENGCSLTYAEIAQQKRRKSLKNNQKGKNR